MQHTDQIEDHDKVVQLQALLNQDPLNWPKLLDLDEELDVIGNESYNCSFIWILKHFPPDDIVMEFLIRHHHVLFSNLDDTRVILINAIRLSSIPVVQYISKNIPSVLNEEMDQKKNTALHLATKVEVAAVLIAAKPNLVGVSNSDMNLPLHEAIIHFCSPEHVKLLVEKGKQFICQQNAHGETPLKILCQQIENGVDIPTLSMPFDRGDQYLWEKLNILIKAHECVSDENNFQILNSLLNLKCPPATIHMAILKEPLQVHQSDEFGNFPLFLVAENSKYGKRTVDDILRANPEAAFATNRYGQFALHSSASSGRAYNEGIDSILNANPAATSASDRDGMLPFLNAASHKTSVDTIYQLFTHCPDSVL